MSKASGKAFWIWLADNTARVQAGIKRDADQMAEEVGDQFEKSYPGLVWEISPSDRGKPWLFCVSANGDRDLFPRVRQAVDEAPKVNGWTIQAFRPRGEVDSTITLNGQTLDGDDVWCEVERARGGGVNLVLHIRGVTEETEDVLTNAAMILMDNAIGEYDSVMKIANLDLALLEDKPRPREDFFPLRDLPAFLDRVEGTTR
jgi:hypothetical protein